MIVSINYSLLLYIFQLEEYTIQQRLGGRRDSAAQISTPPNISPPTGNQVRRRSSLAQITEILKEWSSGGSKRTNKQLSRRETLADLGRSIQGRFVSDKSSSSSQVRKRRESSADAKMSNSSNNPEFIRNWVQEKQDSIILNDSMMKAVSVFLYS